LQFRKKVFILGKYFQQEIECMPHEKIRELQNENPELAASLAQQAGVTLT